VDLVDVMDLIGGMDPGDRKSSDSRAADSMPTAGSTKGERRKEKGDRR
jgi:hypothetical protein